MDWNHTFCQDDDNWYKQGFTDFPYPIAHEYLRLFSMLNDGELYGCIFQLKDVFEVVLKHTVLCLSAVVAVSDDGIFKPFLNPEKLLALGDWAEKITSVLSKHDIIQSDTSYFSLLKNMKGCFGDNNIVNWRNETLGHGALAYKDDPEIVGDLQKKVQILSKFFKVNADAISSLMLYQDGVTLKGDSCTITTDKVSLFHEGTSVSVEPFIIADANRILYFDSYRREGSAYLDYINGKKFVVNYPIWFQKQKNFYSKASVQSDKSVECEIYLANIDDEINALNHEYNYLKASYMKEWVNSCLDKNNKGAFLLCAERGTGKSAFAYAIDELSGGAIKFTDCTTRSYFMNRTLLRNAQDFISQISLIFSLFKNADKTGNSIRSNRPEGLPRLNYATKTPKQDLAKLLNDYRRIHEDKLGKAKLILFIDGIDETTGDDLKLLEFIPETELLDEGVFIFFTCRTGDTFMPPLHVLQLIQNYPFTGSVVFDRHKENKTLLEKYIEKNIHLGGRNLDAAQTEDLINALDYRFTNLNILAELLKTKYIGNFNELINGDFLDNYFSLLKLRYGNKLFNRVAEYIVVLSTLYEPVTVKELVSLVRNSEIEVGDLSILSDLKCLMVTIRSYRGSVYAIENVAYAKKAQSCFKANLDSVVQGFLRRVENYEVVTDSPINGADALLYIAAYFSYYVAEYGIDLGTDFNLESIVDNINNIASEVGRDNQKDYIIIRKTHAYGSIIDHYKMMISSGIATNDQKFKYLVAALNSVHWFSLLKNFSLVEEYKDKVHRIYDELDDEGKNRKGIKQIIMYLNTNLIAFYGERHDYENAVSAYEVAIALADELEDTYIKNLCEKNFCGIERFRNPDNAVRIAQGIVDENEDKTGYALAGEYLQLGQAYWMNLKLDMAKENIFKALDVIEHSGRPRSSHETEILVMVLWRAGQIVNAAKVITLEDLDFAVRSIISGLRFIDERIFAGNLGLEQLKARLLTSFALLCSRRYALHYNENTCNDMDMLQSDYNQALGAISTAEAIWESLDEMGVEYDIPSAIVTHLNYGYILSTFQQFPEGLEKINEAIEKFKPKNPDEDKAIQMALTARIEIQGDYDKWKAGQNS